MKLKKFIINGFSFLFVFLMIYIPAMIIMCKVKYKNKPIIFRTSEIYKVKGGNTYQKFKEFNINEKYDIIVIGSSHAYRSYDPRNFSKLKIKMFNLGSSGQSPLNTYYLVKNYIKSGNCKLVLFDVYDGAFNNNGFESSSDLIQNVSSNKAALQMAASYTNPQILNMLALRFVNLNSPPVFLDSTYVSNGFSQKNDTLRYSLPYEDYENRTSPSPLQAEYMEKTIRYIKEQGISLIMTTIPFPKEKSRVEHDQYSKEFHEIAEKYKIKYFDYSFNTNFNSELHFYDSHHLNQDGVNLYNEILIKDLRANNYFNQP